jgi:hypothetical protein
MKAVLGRSWKRFMLFDKALARRDRPSGQVRERLDRVLNSIAILVMSYIFWIMGPA